MRGKRKLRIMGPLLVGCAVISAAKLRGQAIIAPGGRVLPKRESLVRSFLEVRHLSLRTPDGRSIDVTQYITPVAFVYGFRPNWMLIAAQPYVTADVTTRLGNQQMRQDLNGFADTQLLVQYDGLYSRNSPGGLTRLSGVFGLQLPTGAARFSADSFSYIGGVIFEKVAKLRYAFTGDFEYTATTENDQGSRSGSVLSFDAVPAYFIIPREPVAARASGVRAAFARLFRDGAYAILEFNGTWQGRARERGNKVANSGGTTVSLSPGLQYFLGRRFLVEFSAPIPVVRALNGIQPRPDSTFLLGFRWLF